MSISIIIEEHTGKGPPHRLDAGGISHDSLLYRRMLGAAIDNPRREPKAQQIVRILAAGILNQLAKEKLSMYKSGEKARLIAVAEMDIEKALMVVVKALYEPK